MQVIAVFVVALMEELIEKFSNDDVTSCGENTQDSLVHRRVQVPRASQRSGVPSVRARFI